ncbi:hypothetical protein ABPG75_003698 [Micractinium tetrahymenae]
MPAAQLPSVAKLQRVPSASSVLQTTESDCESPRPLSGPAPTLLESTLSTVAAAVLLHMPLPAQVQSLLRALFPSAAELLASAPATDGLGLEVCILLPAPAGSRAAAREQLAAALPAGGALRFSLSRAPSLGERALMGAFAAALAARLDPRDACLQAPALPQHPATPPATCPAALPADCFWESIARPAPRRSFPRSPVAAHLLVQAAPMKPLRVHRTNTGAHSTLQCAPRSSPQQQPSSSCGCAPHSGHAFGPFEALADAGRLLGRLLEALASAVAGRAPSVPAHAEALLARLFPAATCISATLPSADGQGIVVTTLLHPATAGAVACGDAATGAAPTGAAATAPAQQAQQAQHQHVEPLGHGVCTFQLASPPTGASLRLMRALLQQLDARLCLEAAEGATAAALAARLGGGAGAGARAGPRRQAATGKPVEEAAMPAVRTPAAAPALAVAGQEAGTMPADCFWASF